MPNILFTSSTFPRWQNDTEPPFVFNIAKRIAGQFDDVNICVLAPHYPGTKTQEKINGIKIFRYKYFIPKYQSLCYNGGIIPNIKKNKYKILLIPFFFISQLLNILIICKQEKIDIIHSHWLIPQGLIAAVYKKIFNPKIRIICTIHGSDISGLSSNIFKPIKIWVMNNCDIITTVSKALKKEVKTITHKKIQVINNAVDSTLFKPRPKSNKIIKNHYLESDFILFVGRLSPEKGLEYLIDAMALILQNFPKIKLLVIGDGPKKEKMEIKCKELNISDKIIFLGKISNQSLPQYYQSSKMLIVPSLREGFGINIIESLACANPVIASKVGGITDIIKHKENGILIEPKNHLMIADAVLNLLNSDDLYEYLSKKGLESVRDNFSWEKISMQYYNQYKLLNEQR